MTDFWSFGTRAEYDPSRSAAPAVQKRGPTHMRSFRLPSPALAVAVIAVVLALGGVAFATSGQSIHIVDPVTEANKARVTKGGDLQVQAKAAPAATPLLHSGHIAVGATPIFGPTKATLTIDHVVVRNPAANDGYANTAFVASFRTVSAASGSCTGPEERRLVDYGVRQGTTIADDWNTPLVLKNIGGNPYCVVVRLFGDSTSPTSYWLPHVTVQGSVVSGSYTGPGLPTTASEADEPDRPPFHGPEAANSANSRGNE